MIDFSVTKIAFFVKFFIFLMNSTDSVSVKDAAKSKRPQSKLHSQGGSQQDSDNEDTSSDADSQDENVKLTPKRPKPSPSPAKLPAHIVQFKVENPSATTIAKDNMRRAAKSLAEQTKIVDELSGKLEVRLEAVRKEFGTELEEAKKKLARLQETLDNAKNKLCDCFLAPIDGNS